MRDQCLQMINKYGREVTLPPQTANSGVRSVRAVLDACGIGYETEYIFDADGCRRSPFDIAVLKDGKPALLIEYDGREHYDKAFYENTGVRPERCAAHVVKTAFADAKKTAIAMRFGVPLLRLNELYRAQMRDTLLAWVEVFVNGADTAQGNEVLLMDILEKYGLDFAYVPPSQMSRKEKERFERLRGEILCENYPSRTGWDARRNNGTTKPSTGRNFASS